MRTLKEQQDAGIILFWCLALAGLLVVIFACAARAEDIDTVIIAKLESSGNPFARNGEHYGLCQLSVPVLKDYNRTHKTIWKPFDLYNGVLNLRIAEWYANKEIPRLLRHYNLSDTLENRLTAWRLGIKSLMRRKLAIKYIQAYRKDAHDRNN